MAIGTSVDYTDRFLLCAISRSIPRLNAAHLSGFPSNKLSIDRHQPELTSIIEQIKRLQNNGNVEHEFSIIFTPRRTLVSNTVLETAGIMGDVNISEFPLHFLPLEQDVLSLELDDAFEDLYLVCTKRGTPFAWRRLTMRTA